MGIRQSLNNHKTSGAVITLLVVVSAVAFALWFQRPPRADTFTIREFFSDDDGTTWFVDDGTKLAPFDHNGKPAVIAKVFQCKEGPPFVGYLQKLSDDLKAKIQTSRAQGPYHGGMARADATTNDVILLKKPHEGKWISSNDPAARDIRTFTCPGGGSDFTPVPP